MEKDAELGLVFVVQFNMNSPMRYTCKNNYLWINGEGTDQFSFPVSIPFRLMKVLINFVEINLVQASDGIALNILYVCCSVGSVRLKGFKRKTSFHLCA